MIKKAIMTFAMATLVAGGASAAGDKTYTLSKDKTVTSVTQGSVHYSPPSILGGGHVLFSNFGKKYPKGLYFCCYGDTISGPNSAVGTPFAVALQFTPASDGDVKEIDAGVAWAAGTNSVTIGLYDDNSGVPGNVIASGVATGLGMFGDCCTIAAAKLKEAPVAGGTPYWVVVSATGTTWASWAANSTDQIDGLTIAYSADGGSTWSPDGELPAASFQVLGR